MAPEVLEMSVQQQTRIKCGAWFCEDLVDISTLGTPAFKGYENPLGIYCCEKHYDDSIDQ